MFENTSVLIMTESGSISRLEIDAATQVEICNSFSEARDRLIADKTE